MGARPATRLERSCGREACGPGPRDWLRWAPARVSTGLERIEAYFAGHAYDAHRHDSYAIGVTLSGVQSFDYRGTRVDSTAGKLIVIHPDERHDGRAGAAGGFAYRMLYVEPRLIQTALAGDAGRARSLPFLADALSNDRRLARAVRLALADLDHDIEELDADRIVLELAEALAALDPGIGAPRPSPACAVAVERARQLLDAAANHDEVGRAVASAELEAATGLDRYSLARHFRTLLGTSPYRYLVMRRLDRARALMRAGQSLADAAYAAGFADQSHMTRQFHQAYGVSPGRWRAMGREME